jgi:hypothetical protein
MMAFPDCGTEDSYADRQQASSIDQSIIYLEQSFGSEPYYVLADLERDGDHVVGSKLFKVVAGVGTTV